MKKTTIARFIGHEFIQGSGIVTVTSFGVSVLNYFFNLLVARHVTLSDYGEYSGATAAVMLCAIPSGALGIYLVRRFGKQMAATRWQLASRLERRLTATALHFSPLLFGIGLLLGWWLVEYSHLLLITTMYVVVASMLTLWQVFYLSTVQASQKFWWFGGLQIGFSLTRLLGGFIALQFHPQLPLLLLSMTAATFAQLAFGHWLVKKYTQETSTKEDTEPLPAPRVAQILAFCQRKDVLLPLLTTFGLVGLANLDLIFVKMFFPAEQAGLYSAISLLAKVVLYVTQPLAVVGYTFFTNHEHRDRAKRYLLILILATVGISIGGVIGYSVLGEFTIRLFFDARFLVIQPWLGWAAVYGGLYSLVYLYIQYFLAQNRWRTLIVVVMIALQVLIISLWHPYYTSVLMLNIALCAALVVAYTAMVVWESVPRKSSLRLSLAKQ